MNDKKIAHMLKNSSQKGLCALIEKYRGLVGAIVSRILPGCEEDIEECIADTFLSVWEHRTRLDPGRDTLKSYTACVARNMAIDRYRKLSKVKTIPNDTH